MGYLIEYCEEECMHCFTVQNSVKVLVGRRDLPWGSERRPGWGLRLVLS